MPSEILQLVRTVHDLRYPEQPSKIVSAGSLVAEEKERVLVNPSEMLPAYRESISAWSPAVGVNVLAQAAIALANIGAHEGRKIGCKYSARMHAYVHTQHQTHSNIHIHP